jgi:hypothetical protein
MVTRVIDEHDAHDAEYIISILIIYGDTRLIFELLTDRTLDQVQVEVRKEKGVQGCGGLLDGIQVK